MPPPRVLISNDDGPPGTDSPYIFGLYMVLTRTLGWDVKVVIPSSQKSWIGKAYQIKDIIRGAYYYPKGPDGGGETSDVSRPLREGEVGEWILLDGTPATCTNIALHNLYPDQIDLVVTGPNYGRNTSSAFTLSSGTIGAALSACLSKKRAIAMSYAKDFHESKASDLGGYASTLGANIIQKLWEEWGEDQAGLRNGEVDFYTVNIPIVNELKQSGGLDVVWTSVWRSNYGQLFKREEEGKESEPIYVAGPDAPPAPPILIKASPSNSELPKTSSALVFQFAPNLDPLHRPPPDTLPHGSDSWAMHYRKASVTPLRASFAEPPLESFRLVTEREIEGTGPGREFKLKSDSPMC